MQPKEPEDEMKRLAALLRYQILDTMPEQAYDDIVRLAKIICDVPMCAISLIDTDRQWFKARIGIDVSETARDISFCGHTIVHDAAVFEVSDALQDPRFVDNPLVNDSPFIRFYAGAPIIDGDGHKLGAVCVLDHKARSLSDDQRAGLMALARQVAELLKYRAGMNEIAENERFKLFMDNSPTMAFVSDESGVFRYANKTFLRVFDKAPSAVIGQHHASIWSADFVRRIAEQDARVLQAGKTVIEDQTLQEPGKPVTHWKVFRFPLRGGERLIGGIAIDITESQRDRQHLENALDKLEVLSSTDPLTGLGNRRALDENIKAEIDYARRHQVPLSFLMIDVDRFKQFNDNFGHPAGDRLLRSIAQTLMENARMHDVVARYGGEEFAVVLRNTALEGALVQAERLRHAVEKMPPKDVTVSIGVAQYQDRLDGVPLMISSADAALYQAKHAGRNCVTADPGKMPTLPMQ